MANKKQESSFTVSDRRLFTSEGDLRTDVPEQPTPAPPPAPAAEKTAAPPFEPILASAPPSPAAEAPTPDETAPPPPTDAEQKEKHDAYQKSAKELDARVELSGHSAKEMEMTFERFMASLYMTAMLQLGLMHEQGGQPRVDIIGARQTIDTLGLLAEKTRNNLTAVEQNFLQNCLYELRMAYVEVTNALARPHFTGTEGGPPLR
jgi:Domain of unknown function (DUF1844)